MSSDLAFISDGYTQRGFIRGEPRLHPAIRFEYRPATLPEVVGYRKQAATLDAMPLYQHAAKFVSGKLLSWDLQDGETSAPTSPEWLLKLRYALFLRLLNIVLGLDASDEDPDWADADKKAHQDDAAAAAGAAMPLQQFRDERDRKN